MTTACGGGASTARPGFGLSVSVGTGILAAALNNVPTPLAIALAGAIGVLNYELSTYCTTDPPAMPTLTAQDYVDALDVYNVPANLAAIAKFRDFFGNLFWPTFCECTSGTTPAPPTLPAPPSGLPTVNPPQLTTAPPAYPCWNQTQAYTRPVVSATTFVYVGSDLLPTGATQSVTPSETGGPTTAWVIPSGISNITFSGIGSGTDPGPAAEMDWFNSSGSVIRRDLLSWSSGGSGTRTITSAEPPAGATAWDVWIDSFWGGTGFPQGSIWDVSLSVSYFCAGSNPATPLTPCCPPDPSLLNMVQRLIALSESILTSLPTPINSYAEATVHSSLTGNGSFTLADAAIAVKVTLTTIPGYIGEAAGSPNIFFDAGFVSTITVEAPQTTQRILYADQLIGLPILTEQIGYSLAPGVVATITELVRGP